MKQNTALRASNSKNHTHIIFKNQEHEEFYYSSLKNCRYQDSYYIGNGIVANNVGHFSIESLPNWISWQTATCQGHTGWIGWIYPGGVPK